MAVKAVGNLIFRSVILRFYDRHYLVEQSEYGDDSGYFKLGWLMRMLKATQSDSGAGRTVLLPLLSRRCSPRSGIDGSGRITSAHCNALHVTRNSEFKLTRNNFDVIKVQ